MVRLLLIFAVCLIIVNSVCGGQESQPCQEQVCGPCLEEVGCGWCPSVFGGVCLPVNAKQICQPSVLGNWTTGPENATHCPKSAMWMWPMSGSTPMRSYAGSFPMRNDARVLPIFQWNVTLPMDGFSGTLPREVAIGAEGIIVAGSDPAAPNIGRVALVNFDGTVRFNKQVPFSPEAVSISTYGLIWLVDRVDVATVTPDDGTVLYHSGYGSSSSPWLPTRGAPLANLSSRVPDAIFGLADGSVVALTQDLRVLWLTDLKKQTNIANPDASRCAFALHESTSSLIFGIADAHNPYGYTDENYVAAIDIGSGKVRWVTKVDGDIVGVAIEGDVAVASGWRAATVTGLDAVTGRILWKAPFGNTTDGYPLDPMPVSIDSVHKMAFAATSNGGPTEALDIATGARRWSSSVSSDSPSLVIGDVVIVIESYRHLVALDQSTGKTLWRLDIPVTSISSFAANTLLVMNANTFGEIQLTWFTF